MMLDTIAISFCVYTLIVILLGLVSTRFARKSTSDFLLADRGLGAWVAGLSSAASSESGWVTLGLVGFAFNTGIAALWIVPGTVLAFLFNWLVLARRLRQRSESSEALTLPDILATPYSGKVATTIRLIGVLIILSMLTLYVAAQLNAAGTMFTAAFGWKYLTGVLVGAGIVVLYTITGGFRAIAWTDVLQSTFMILALVVVPILLVLEMGGVDELTTRLKAMEGAEGYLSATGGQSGWALFSFLTIWLGIPMGNFGQPHVLVRLMAAKDETAIRRAAIISSVWVFFLFVGAVMLGVCARAWYGSLENPEQALPLIAREGEVVPALLGGMIIAAILAAIASTADSQLLVSASTVSHDLFTRVFGKQASELQKMIIDRSAVILVGVIAVLIAASNVESVFSFVLDYGWAGLGSAFGPAVIFSLLWSRTTGTGIIAGMIVGIATAMIWKQFPDLQSTVYNMFPAFIASCIAVVGVSLLTQDQAHDSSERA